LQDYRPTVTAAEALRLRVQIFGKLLSVNIAISATTELSVIAWLRQVLRRGRRRWR